MPSTTEHTRLLYQHNALVSLVKGRIVHAPIESPDKILEVGCGTGIVTRYLATHFPTASSVTGVDLCSVPSEPTDASLNLHFIQGDFRELAGTDDRLQYNSMSFVYSRLLLCGMTDWQGYVCEMFSMLQPGGWAEFGDFVEDIFYTDRRGRPRNEWLQAIRDGGLRKGLDLDCGTNINSYMEKAGFVDVQRWEYQVPLWRDETRPETRLMTELMIDDRWGLYWHMLPKMLEGMGYDEKAIGKLREEMKWDMRDEEGKYQLFTVTIGRKPG